jgi:2,4-dienoyl-CoA reductase-like NADH-dependent reductase (Old Yellow Enzyme family)
MAGPHRAINYLAKRAAGGTGLITTALTYVDVKVEPKVMGPFIVSGSRADSPSYLARLEELPNALHAHEAKIAVQLTAGGTYSCC